MINDGAIALRAWRVSDAAWYVACSRDEAIQRFTIDPPDLDAADVAAAIRQSAASEDRDAFLICTADGAQRLGNLAIGYRDRVAEVSYWVAPDARGRCVAAAALRLLLTHLRTQARVEVVELWTHAENIASRRAAERAGFERDLAADGQRTAKGVCWPTVAYRQRA